MGGLPPKFKIPTFFSQKETIFLGKGEIQQRITRPQILQNQIRLLKHRRIPLLQQVLKMKHRIIASQSKASNSILKKKILTPSITICSKQILFLRTLSKTIPQIITCPVSWIQTNLMTHPNIKALQTSMGLAPTSKNHFSLKIKISYSHHSLHRLQKANHLYSANQLLRPAQILSSKIKPHPLEENNSHKQAGASH
jgi:hypothetical protein